MSDFNAVISQVDRSMDMLEAFLADAEDVRAHAAFDMTSLAAAVNRETEAVRRTIENSDPVPARLKRRYEIMLDLQQACAIEGTDLMTRMNSLYRQASELSEDGLQEMGRYISKLNRARARAVGKHAAVPLGPDQEYIWVVDSARHPQTAEHIRTAQDMGFPRVLTLDRENAAQRRKESLAHVRTCRYFDRDEYPPAVFLEGGFGADVVRVEGRDNRSAGAVMRWQLQHIPDGARIRIRVV